MPLPKERKAIRIHTLKQSGDGNTVRHIFSVSGVMDDGRDVIHLGAFQKTLNENRDRVKVLWSHDYMSPPIGRVNDIKEVLREDLPPEILKDAPDATGGLYAEVEYLPTPRGQEVLTGIKQGAITENSIGYDPVKFDWEDGPDGWPVRNLREVRLMDISPVVWGMNPYTGNYKSAVPFQDTGTADEADEYVAPVLADFTDAPWDELPDGEKSRIAAHFAWGNAGPPESFSDLKLPHHLPSKTGVGPAIWMGVDAAMTGLLQAKTDIPMDELRGVYAHLSGHFKQYSKDVPDFKLLELAAHVKAAHTLVKASPDLLKSGRVLSATNFERLRNALDMLSAVLAAAEPPEDDTVEDGVKRVSVVQVNAKALTEQLNRRLELAERELALHS